MTCVGFLFAFMGGEAMGGYKGHLASNDDKMVCAIMLATMSAVVSSLALLLLQPNLTGVANEAFGVIGAYMSTITIMLLWMEWES